LAVLNELYLGPRAAYGAGNGSSRLGNDVASLKPTLLAANTQHIFTIYNPSTKVDFLQWTISFLRIICQLHLLVETITIIHATMLGRGMASP
jgi:hypothetical protein